MKVNPHRLIPCCGFLIRLDEKAFNPKCNNFQKKTFFALALNK